MASIYTRQNGTTGINGVTRLDAPLTNDQIDSNFINLNNNKLESSWTGNTSIVTLGTVTTGTWSATTIAVNKGGTGVTTTPSNGNLLIGNGSGYTVAALTGTSNRVTVTNGSGSITLSTPQDIATSSKVQFASIGVNTSAPSTNGQIVATGDVISAYSDERLKENIEQIENALSKVLAIRGVTYTTNELAEQFGYSNKESQVGVLAKEVLEVLPEAVKPAPFDTEYDENGNAISKSGQNYKTVQYERIVPLLIEAIRELNKEIQDLKVSK